ncbi:MAG: DUF192 domain-containing protein [Longimicrobiales bacterium]|nr:DUF192 domain-containing protein [Longimicrobiales bacterium]
MLEAVFGAAARPSLRASIGGLGVAPVFALALALALALGGCGDAEAGVSSDAATAGPDASAPPGSSLTRDAEARPDRGTAWVIFGDEAEADTIFAEVARTEAERAEGLMYREEIAEDAGMLFVFPTPAVRSFWMQNTFIPLDIAFMDVSFRIFEIHPMEPESTEYVESAGPAHFALEVNRGWFAEHGVGVGTTPRVVFGI